MVKPKIPLYFNLRAEYIRPHSADTLHMLPSASIGRETWGSEADWGKARIRRVRTRKRCMVKHLENQNTVAFPATCCGVIYIIMAACASDDCSETKTRLTVYKRVNTPNTCRANEWCQGEVVCGLGHITSSTRIFTFCETRYPLNLLS